MGKSRSDKVKRNSIIMGLVAIGLMVTGVFGLFGSGGSGGQHHKYNGYDFYLGNQGWFTRVGDQQIIFTYLPDDVDNITLPQQVKVDDIKVYLVKDYDKTGVYDWSIDKMKAAFYYLTPVRVQDACISEENCDETFPLVKCESTDVQILHFKYGNKTENYKKDKCIVFEIDITDEDQISEMQVYMDRLSERVLYDIIRIIN